MYTGEVCYVEVKIYAMKKLNHIRKPRLNKVLLGVLAILMVSGSCKKDNNDVILEGDAKVMVVHAAEGSPDQDFYLDNTKVNVEAIAYNESTAYIATPAGYGRKAEFKNSGSETVNFTGNVDLLPERSYTFFYTTRADGTENSSAVFADETVSSASKAKVRFVNLAGGFTNADLLIAGGSSLVSNISFATASNFIELDPGTIAFQTVLSSGTGGSFDIGTFTLAAGKIYTIYTSGSLTSTVSAHLITHN